MTVVIDINPPPPHRANQVLLKNGITFILRQFWLEIKEVKILSFSTKSPIGKIFKNLVKGLGDPQYFDLDSGEDDT